MDMRPFLDKRSHFTCFGQPEYGKKQRKTPHFPFFSV